MKYVCELCGTLYDEQVGIPARGIPAGTAFSALPEQFECPGCGSQREAFNPAGQFRAVGKTVDDRLFWQDAKYSDEHHSSDR